MVANGGILLAEVDAMLNKTTRIQDAFERELARILTNPRVTLVDVRAHRVSLSEDRVIADIPPEARVATSALENARMLHGTLYAGDTLFPSVGAADEVMGVEMVLWNDTGDEATSPLVAAWTAATVPDRRWPIYAIGGDIYIRWGEEGVLSWAIF